MSGKLRVDTSELRHKIDGLIASQSITSASRSLAELWNLDKSSSAASFVVSRYEALRSRLKLASYRVAVLRSFTVEPVVPLLRAAAFIAGIDLSIYLSEFNAYAQEILDPDSALYTFKPDAVFLAAQTRDIAPELWRDFSSLNAEQTQDAATRVSSEIRKLVQAFRSRSQAHLIIHNLEHPETASTGLLDGQASHSQAWAIQEINRALQKITSEQSGIYILDYDVLTARHGRAQWHDERKWLTVRMPISSPNLIHLASEWLRFLHPLTGKLAKVL
ncbi:MAG: hypothetical protein JOY93_04065, partial [Acidobacteriales bacterium]|nr:hypothetical protein [Terriglobales bacterium]